MIEKMLSNLDMTASAKFAPHLFLAIALLASSTFVQATLAAQPIEACVLPQDLQREVAGKYPTAKLIELSDLEEDDKKFFQSDHDNSCPGVVKVDFYGDGKPTLALVLIPRSRSKERTKLVVARQYGGKWVITPLDTGGPTPDAPVVWSLPPGEYRDVYGEKNIRATNPVIVFCKYEAWAILYAWTGKSVSKIWLMD
jgi:hypothetical protein